MSCYDGPLKRERSMKSEQSERKWTNLVKATDFNRYFAVTSAMISKIIGRGFCNSQVDV